MRFDTSQQMRMGQQMKLAPRMIQSMEILQMSQMQLEERVVQELESNPTLEAMEPGADPNTVDAAQQEAQRTDSEGERELDVDAGSAKDDFERLDAFETANPDASDEYSAAPEGDRFRRDETLGSYSASRMAGERDGKMDAMANTAARSASLQEQLLDQWILVGVEDCLRPLGEQIIGYIESDGYLRTDLATIADRMPARLGTAATEDMDRALQAVQLLLEPAGVAARDTRECLLLQIDALEVEDAADWSLARALTESHLEDLAQNRLPKVAEKTGRSIDEVKRAIEMMRILSLAPARQLVEEQTSNIIPDAIVEYDTDGDRYIAYLNDRRLPNLQVNREYALMARDREVVQETRSFIKKNLSNASWLIDAVEQRRRTLLRVINVVVEAQRDFFDYGPQALKPLPMTQVADQLGVHVATVSRAVAEKYLETPRGTVPLRQFFTGGTQTESGEDVSWAAIKAALKEVIDTEDKAKPLSDEGLAEALKERGIEIARRTVAKYRGQLNIPSARLRKAH